MGTPFKMKGSPMGRLLSRKLYIGALVQKGKVLKMRTRTGVPELITTRELVIE
jgi:hypothetical protein